MGDSCTLRPVDPMYRACFADGAELRVRHGREAMAEEIRATCGTADAAAFGRLLRLAAPSCTGSRCRTSSTATSTRPLDLARPLAAGAASWCALGAFGRLGP